MTNNPEVLLKFQDVATRLNVSISTVRRLIKTGKLRAVKIGKSVRVKPADLLSYLTELQTLVILDEEKEKNRIRDEQK